MVSHFWVVVLTRTGTEEEVERLLAPYDENLQVPEHKETCSCVGMQAWREATFAADQTVAPKDELQRTFLEQYADKPYYWFLSLDGQLRFQKHIEAYRKTRQEAFDRHPLRDSPDPNCNECGGRGFVLTTANPKAKWDWWVIGGHWYGEITGHPKSDEKGFNLSPKFNRIKDNRSLVAPLLSLKILPFAVVTPDGQWYEQGNMGWFGQASDLKEDWPQQVKQLFETHPDCVAVSVDCHI